MGRVRAIWRRLPNRHPPHAGGNGNPAIAPAGDNPLLAAALEYAARGWHVFPCAPGGKAPITPHGLKDATTSADTIRAWWAAVPTANVAIAAGRSDLLIVDCDGPEGIGTFAAWAEAHDVPLGDVPCATTPRGGRHDYFAAAADVELGPKVRVLPGVDIRAGESYVIAPPSRWGG